MPVMRARLSISGCDGIVTSMGYLPATDIDSSAQSPCVRNCCLDDDLICVGCFRTLEEIKEWGVADNNRRDAILQAVERRRQHNLSPTDWTD